MTFKNVDRLFDYCAADAALSQRMGEWQDLASEEWIPRVAALGAELGFAISETDVAAWMTDSVERYRVAYDDYLAARGELSEDELELVSGGVGTVDCPAQ